MSRALVDHMKLKTKPHPHSYIIGWIKNGPTIKVLYLYYVSLSVGKFYQDFIACDVVDMDKCYIFFGEIMVT